MKDSKMKAVANLDKWLLAPVLVAGLLVVAGCSTAADAVITSPQPINTTRPVPSVSAAGSLTPSVQILSPWPSAQVGAGSVTVVVSVNNFTLVSAPGRPNVSGQGHINYFMDADPPTAAGQPALTALGTYTSTTDTSYAWGNVGSGQHTFSVELVNHDETPLSPPVTDSVAFQVVPQNGFPLALIVSPRSNAVIEGNSVTIDAQVANFILADKVGQPNQVNEGHLMYFMDVDAPTIMKGPGIPATTAPGTYVSTSDTSYTWQNVSPGVHSFSIELVNNDSTPINPPITAKIIVNVRGGSSSSAPSESNNLLTSR